MSQELNDKIEDFVSNYYNNEIFKGLLKFLIISLSILFISFVLEYFVHFNTQTRTILFYSIIIMSGWVFYQEVLNPLLKKWKLIPGLKEEEAASLIGNHFSGVNDSLLNTLQLSKQANPSELLSASIEQKFSKIQPLNFKDALDRKEFKKYFKLFFPVIAIIVVFSIVQPKIIADGGNRIISYSEEFIPPAPFNFAFDQDSWKIEKGKSLDINIKTKGEKLPNEINLVLDGKAYPTNQLSSDHFIYRFSSINEDQTFHVQSGPYRSKTLTISVFPSPSISGFRIKADYPNYTGYTDKTFSNTGNLLIPEGTTIEWALNGKDCDSIFMKADKNSSLFKEEKDSFHFQKKIFQDYAYQIDLINKHQFKEGVFNYEIKVIKDAYPVIEMNSDSNQLQLLSGYISDDYGFDALLFHVEKNGKTLKIDTLALQESIGQAFVHEFNPQSFNLDKNEEIEFYFEVKDNDRVNGSKSSFSVKQFFKSLSDEELVEKMEQSSQELQANASDAFNELNEVQKSIEKFRQKLNQKNNLSWEDKQDLQNILNQQKSLEKKIEQIQKANSEKNETSKQKSEKEKQLLDKQKQLEELFDEIFDEETKKLMEEIEKMMDELNKDKLEDMMKDLDISNEMMEQELDRSLELFKQLEFDLKMEETIQDLEKLAEKQKALAEESEKSDKADSPELQEKQKKLNEEFDRLEKEIKSLKEKNDQLEEKREMADTEKQEENIKQEQQESSESLDQKKNKKASQSQSKAAEQMKQMAQQMQQVSMQQQQEQQQEDMESLRTLLDNLIELSHQQERLKSRMLNTNRNDPKYPKLKQAQASIRDESKLVEDSLFALSKRVPQLKSTVNKEISEINRNLNTTLDQLSNNKVSQASINQQLIMTSYNNLALILDDVLNQMQQQMKMSNQSCNKPGNNKKPSMSMSQMQKQLNQQMKKMQEQMQKEQGKQGGKKPSSKPGDQQGQGQGTSQQIARMAAQQAAIRSELQNLKKKLEQTKSDKQGLDNVNKALEEMEKQERDLYNKNLNNEFFKRQQEILSRLLEAENAEKEQEWDNKRESSEGKNEEKGNPKEFEKYKRLKKKEAEQLRTVSPNLKPHYKRKVREYNKVND